MKSLFSAQVADFAKKTEQTQANVLHQSLRLVAEEVTKAKGEGGHMPVVSGNLRNSVAVSTLGPVAIDWKTKKFRDPSDSVNNAVAGVKVGQTAYVGFRAPYAHKVEVENGFVRLTAQRWPAIVDQAVRDVGKG